MKNAAMFLAISLCLVASTTAGALPDVIECGGVYKGHLQGVATDGKSIYWSFTHIVVRTDLSGKVLASAEAPQHQGDLCVKGDVVYVAVNRGKFNQENAAVSEVMSYDASTLRHLKTWKLDMPHGAGGMTYVGDRLYVIGGLPATHERNYVYEYDEEFNLVKRHELATGFTLMGIQTAAFEDGRFYFGIYGCTGNPSGVITSPKSLDSFERWLDSGDVGMVKLDGDYFTGSTFGAKKGPGGWRGRLVRAKNFPSRKYVAPTAVGKGRLVVFFEGRDKAGWKDCGYELTANGYAPLCSDTAKEPHVKVASAEKMVELPAVGIGGTRRYSAPDIVRALRRAAVLDEVLALHVPGTPETVREDVVLETTLDAVLAEARRLGIKIEGL